MGYEVVESTSTVPDEGDVDSRSKCLLDVTRAMSE